MLTEAFIAWRYTISNPKQAALIGLAVGLGVSIIVFIPSVNTGFFNQMLTKTVQGAPHVTVKKQEKALRASYRYIQQATEKTHLPVVSDFSKSQRNDSLLAYRSLMQQLEKVEGVQAVSPELAEQVVVVKGPKRLTANLRGLDPQREPLVTDIETKLKVGRLQNLVGNNAILGWRLADELGLRLGQRFTVVSAAGQRSLKLVGLTDSGLYFTDIQSLLVALPEAQSVLGKPNQVSSLGLKLNDMEAAPELAAQVASQFQVKTLHWVEQNEEILKQISNFRVIVSFINFLIIAAAASSITSMLIMTVANKSREIGILKAMGMQPAAIARIFVFQALWLSVLGIIAGLLGGQGLINLYNATPIAKATVMGVTRQPVTMSVEFAMLAATYAFITSMLASIIPAWQASRLDPVQAISQ
jgi:lipoprotein-releasing system permease protein